MDAVAYAVLSLYRDALLVTETLAPTSLNMTEYIIS